MGLISKLLCILSLLINYNVINASQKIGADILLVINYNHAHYNSIPFLKELYSPYFPNIVFVGPKLHPEVEFCDHDRGYYGYKSIAQIMIKYPHYQGYLWVHDDCVINPWNFQRFDQSKIWFNNPGIAQLDPAGLTKWVWWRKAIGYQAIKNVYDKLSQKHKDALRANCGENRVFWGYSDIVYIPTKYASDIIGLCALLNREHSFLEIALPTLCGCLDNKKNWEMLSGLALWNRENPKVMYSQKLDYLHPMKFSNQDYQNFIREQFKQYKESV